jgi:hypothetical protein
VAGQARARPASRGRPTNQPLYVPARRCPMQLCAAAGGLGAYSTDAPRALINPAKATHPYAVGFETRLSSDLYWRQLLLGPPSWAQVLGAGLLRPVRPQSFRSSHVKYLVLPIISLLSGYVTPTSLETQIHDLSPSKHQLPLLEPNLKVRYSTTQGSTTSIIKCQSCVHTTLQRVYY